MGVVIRNNLKLLEERNSIKVNQVFVDLLYIMVQLKIMKGD